MIFDYSNRSVLRNSLFKGLDKSCFNKYFNTKNFYVAKEGEIIYTNGDESAFLYLIIGGEIKIKLWGKKEFVNRYLFDFFGEYEILQSTKRRSSAMAMKDTLIYKIKSELLRKLCSANTKISSNLKGKYEIDNTKLGEALDDEIILPLPIDEIHPENESILSNNEIKKEPVTEISEAELDLIVQNLKSHQEFKSVMKKVGKVDGDEYLKQELIEDSDSDEWQFVPENGK